MGLVLMGPTRRQSQPKAPLDQPAAGQKADESEPPPALSTRGGAEPPTTLQLRPSEHLPAEVSTQIDCV